MTPQDFYSSLAENYHLMFEDWEASMARQAAALAPILTSLNAKNVLDCACGIGTQSLGLAQQGFQMTGTDISQPAINRARREAANRGLQIEFNTANILDLPPAQYDAVICMDNAFPHFETQAELTQAVTKIHACLKPGGHLVASIRDYDELIRTRPTIQGPSFYPNRIVHQIWDWQDDRHYLLHLYLTLNTECHHYTTSYRALLRAELDEALETAGFAQPEWRLPEATGFYQPIVITTSREGQT